MPNVIWPVIRSTYKLTSAITFNQKQFQINLFTQSNSMTNSRQEMEFV